ncbi:MAG: HAD-IIB family hydrolase [Clostridia bacterium]|nr:HAD-IIB family hydrolase [Clostridia bacterium]
MKIIATDYDGTLNHKGITEEKRAAISKWRRAGNLFGVVSGRGVKSLLEVIQDKDFEYDFLIANNGAIIFDKELNILAETQCDGAIAKPLIEDLFQWSCPFANVDKDEPVMVRSNAEDCKDGECTLADLPEVTYFNQISTWLGDKEKASAVVDKINEKYSDTLNPLQNGDCIDIVPISVNKAQGIYALLHVVGGKYEDVIAVGDNINDTHMIAEFRSYAMENGVDSIKALADEVTEGITELIYKELQ